MGYRCRPTRPCRPEKTYKQTDNPPSFPASWSSLAYPYPNNPFGNQRRALESPGVAANAEMTGAALVTPWLCRQVLDAIAIAARTNGMTSQTAFQAIECDEERSCPATGCHEVQISMWRPVETQHHNASPSLPVHYLFWL